MLRYNNLPTRDVDCTIEYRKNGSSDGQVAGAATGAIVGAALGPIGMLGGSILGALFGSSGDKEPY